MHTGVQVRGDTTEGVAIHIAARVAALANRVRCWYLRSVRDLLAGSGLRFELLEEHALKGIPDLWRVYAVD